MTGGLLAGCGSKASAPGTSSSSSSTSSTPAATTKERIYIPVISKGFQHQFWQAVKLGAEKA